jgi:hypothetical protein
MTSNFPLPPFPNQLLNQKSSHHMFANNILKSIVNNNKRSQSVYMNNDYKPHRPDISHIDYNYYKDNVYSNTNYVNNEINNSNNNNNNFYNNVLEKDKNKDIWNDNTDIIEDEEEYEEKLVLNKQWLDQLKPTMVKMKKKKSRRY